MYVAPVSSYQSRYRGACGIPVLSSDKFQKPKMGMGAAASSKAQPPSAKEVRSAPSAVPTLPRPLLICPCCLVTLCTVCLLQAAAKTWEDIIKVDVSNPGRSDKHALWCMSSHHPICRWVTIMPRISCMSARANPAAC
jgi:hypothetical protein